jgi:hypothetical protein
MAKRGFALLLGLLLLSGQGGIASAGNNIDGEEIRAFDFDYEGAPQGDREAGAYPVMFTNTTSPITDPAGFHEILFVRIAAAHRGATKQQIIAAIDARDLCPSGCFFDYIAGGAFGPPGSTTPGVGPDFKPGPVQLLPGRYVYFCAVPESDGTRHYNLGMIGTFRAR